MQQIKKSDSIDVGDYTLTGVLTGSSDVAADHDGKKVYGWSANSGESVLIKPTKIFKNLAKMAIEWVIFERFLKIFFLTLSPVDVYIMPSLPFTIGHSEFSRLCSRL